LLFFKCQIILLFLRGTDLHYILHCKHGEEDNWPAQRNFFAELPTKGIKKKVLPPPLLHEKKPLPPLNQVKKSVYPPRQCAIGPRGYYCSPTNTSLFYLNQHIP